MAIDVHKRSSMNSHSRASHFLLQPLAWTLCTQEQTTRVVNHDSQNSVSQDPLSCTSTWWQRRSGFGTGRILEKMNCNREVVPMSRGKHGMDALLSSCFFPHAFPREKNDGSLSSNALPSGFSYFLCFPALNGSHFPTHSVVGHRHPQIPVSSRAF